MIRASRRGFITGLGAALITAPAIVRAGSLMPVKAIIEPCYGMGPWLMMEEWIAIHEAERRLIEAKHFQRAFAEEWMESANYFGVPAR